MQISNLCNIYANNKNSIGIGEISEKYWWKKIFFLTVIKLTKYEGYFLLIDQRSTKIHCFEENNS